MTFKPYILAFAMLFLANKSFLAGDDKSKEIQVLKNGQGDYKTIQEAINESPEGSTIVIGPGEWTEQLKISRPVRLRGAGLEKTIISSSSQDKPQPTEDFLKVLVPIMNELDVETRKKVQEAYIKVYEISPALIIKETKNVVIENISFVTPNRSPRQGLKPNPSISITNSSVRLEKCAVLESPGVGIHSEGDSHVKINKSLITNCWNRGVSIRISETGSFELSNSEIRNNYYSGISIGSKSPDIKITHCLIHGTGWHGIRYDNSAPVITDNLFHSTAVSGIYASGKTNATIKGNLFYHSGVSCWFQNQDIIESNTFIGDHQSEKKSGITQGLQVLGASLPTIKNNLFVTCQNAIYQGMIGSKSKYAQVEKPVSPEKNIFWKNEINLAQFNTETKEKESINLPEGNREQQPDFVDAENRDFHLKQGSDLSKSHLGASNFASFDSPWPFQPGEEKNIEAVTARMKQTNGQR